MPFTTSIPTPIYFTEWHRRLLGFRNFGDEPRQRRRGTNDQRFAQLGKTVVMWNIALDPTGGPTVQHGCVTAAASSPSIPATAPATVRACRYYALGHLSKFVEREPTGLIRTCFGSGSVRMSHSESRGSIGCPCLQRGPQRQVNFSLNWQGNT